MLLVMPLWPVMNHTYTTVVPQESITSWYHSHLSLYKHVPWCPHKDANTKHCLSQNASPSTSDNEWPCGSSIIAIQSWSSNMQTNILRLNMRGPKRREEKPIFCDHSSNAFILQLGMISFIHSFFINTTYNMYCWWPASQVHLHTPLLVFVDKT